jgi:23S rRNA (cytidine1920-2'-O)/16S rRNA (cytidine1409-2'-O)-methyltransferase
VADRAPTQKRRLDQLLVDRDLAASRGEAHSLITQGRVQSAGRALTRPGMAVGLDIPLDVDRPQRPFASRGGLKLAAALDRFAVPVQGQIALDVGASTGGFTDVLLRHGATRVYAVDVGYGQIAWSLRTDPRVVVHDRTNIRHLTRLPEVPGLATIDVSFISLELVLPAVRRLIECRGHAVALIKPQFEVGRGQVGKGGVVRDPASHALVLRRVLAAAQDDGWAVGGVIASPITGPAGNREFLAWLHHDLERGLADVENEIEGATSGGSAHPS